MTYLKKSLQRLRQYYLRQQFSPSFPLGWFANIIYISRKSLYNHIKKLAPLLRGAFLDYGCGTMPYRHLFQYESYLGVEYGDPGQSTPEIIYTYELPLPLEAESFDAIICTEVLGNVKEVDDVIKEFYRLLRSGGKVLISVSMTWPEEPHPHDMRRFTPEGLAYLLEKHGFRPIHIVRTTPAIQTLAQLAVELLWRDLRHKLPFGRGPLRYLYYAVIVLFFNLPVFALAYLLSSIIPDRKRRLPLDVIILAEVVK